jgi:hypothetical protein
VPRPRHWHRADRADGDAPHRDHGVRDDQRLPPLPVQRQSQPASTPSMEQNRSFGSCAPRCRAAHGSRTLATMLSSPGERLDRPSACRGPVRPGAPPSARTGCASIAARSGNSVPPPDRRSPCAPGQYEGPRLQWLPRPRCQPSWTPGTHDPVPGSARRDCALGCGALGP